MKLYTVFEKVPFDRMHVDEENLTARQIVAKYGGRLDDPNLFVRENGDLGDATRIGAWFESMHRPTHTVALDSAPRFKVGEELEQLLAHYFRVDIGNLHMDDTIGCFRNDVFDLFEAAFNAEVKARKARLDCLNPDELDLLESYAETALAVERRKGVEYTIGVFWAMHVHAAFLDESKWKRTVEAAQMVDGDRGIKRVVFLRDMGRRLFENGWRIQFNKPAARGQLHDIPSYADMWRFFPAWLGDVEAEFLVFVYRIPSKRAADGDPVEG